MAGFHSVTPAVERHDPRVPGSLELRAPVDSEVRMLSPRIPRAALLGTDRLRRSGVLPAAPFLVALLLAIPTALTAQEPGNIFGVVYDARTGETLTGVQVVSVEHERSAISDEAGTFSLVGLAPRATLLRFQFDGYVSEVEELEVEEASTYLYEVYLNPLAAILEELTVSARQRASPTRNRAGGESRFRLTERELQEMTGSLSDLLQSRVAGLALSKSGEVGGRASQVQIRGRSSLSLSTAPLIILDGIRLEGTSMRVLDEILVSDVRSLEVLRGPAAHGYGLGSANGVIVIHRR
jgi:TonB-dependent starch-binding outer membrane protein SusC